MYMYVYVCICMYMYVYMYVYIYTSYDMLIVWHLGALWIFWFYSPAFQFLDDDIHLENWQNNMPDISI
jgi:hypothetical protein